MKAFHQAKQGMSLFLPHLSSGSDLVLNPVYIHGFSACSNLVVLLVLSICCGCNRVRKASVSSQSNQKSSFLLYKPTLLACMGLSSFYLVICVLNYFFWYRNGWADEKLVTQLDLGLRTLAWVAIFVYLYTHFSNSSERKFPLWLRVWWGVFFLMSSSSLTIDLVRHQKHQSLQTHFWVLDVVSVVVGLFFLCTGIYGKRVEESLLEEPLLNGSNGDSVRNSFLDENVSLFGKANLLSILTFSWMSPLIAVGKKKTIDLEDVPQLAPADSVNGVYPVFKNKLDSFTSDGGQITSMKLVKALVFATWREILLTALLCLVYTLASYVGPYLIDTFVRYLNGYREFENEGYMLVSAFFLAKVVECISQRHWFFILQQVGYRARAALIVAIYKKGQTLSSQ